jgi:hypothetical protein
MYGELSYRAAGARAVSGQTTHGTVPVLELRSVGDIFSAISAFVLSRAIPNIISPLAISTLSAVFPATLFRVSKRGAKYPSKLSDSNNIFPARLPPKFVIR